MIQTLTKGMNVTLYMNDKSVYYGEIENTEITIVNNVLDGWITIHQPHNDTISTENYGTGTFGLKDIRKVSIN